VKLNSDKLYASDFNMQVEILFKYSESNKNSIAQEMHNIMAVQKPLKEKAKALVRA